jgi:RNA polymerase sigma-70 factor (ECF subfamily)
VTVDGDRWPRDDRRVDLSEQLLVLRCQVGDEAAFAALVERYGPRLRYYLRKMLGRPGEVEDALQEVWFDVFRSVGRLGDPRAFPTWLYRIAHDRAARHFRRARPAPEPLPNGEVGEDAGAGDFTAEDAEQVHAALDALAPEHREVLVLRFLEEMSYEEIARATGGQLGTVKSRIHYAKRALRRALERTNAHE